MASELSEVDKVFSFLFNFLPETCVVIIGERITEDLQEKIYFMMIIYVHDNSKETTRCLLFRPRGSGPLPKSAKNR